MRPLLQLIGRLAQKIFQSIKNRGKPRAKMTPEKIQGNRANPNTTKQAKKDPAQQPDQENSTFFVDRLEAGGTKPMRKFYAKHRDRLRNQDAGPQQDHGMER